MDEPDGPVVIISTALGALLALACGASQLALTLALHDDRGRAAQLKAHRQSRTARPRTTPATALDRIGRFTLAVLHGQRRKGPLRPGLQFSAVSSQAAGAAVVAAVCFLPMGPVVALGAAAGAWTVPHVRHRRAQRARLAALAEDMPEVVDLIALALAAGLNVSLAVEAVGGRGTGPLAREMGRAAKEAGRGRRLADALEDLSMRCGEATRPLMALLASGERYGVPLVQSLDRLATDIRATQRRRAEEAARRLPVKMLFPLVVCILPAFALLTLGPLLVTSLQSLSW